MADKFDLYNRGQTTNQGTATSPEGAMPSTGLVPATTYTIYVPFAVIAGSTADDVTIFAANCPMKMKVVDVKAVVTTGVNSATLKLYPAAAASGTTLSATMTCSGTSAQLLDGRLLAAAQDIAVGGSLYCRRSDNGTAGELWITVVPLQ